MACWTKWKDHSLAQLRVNVNHSCQRSNEHENPFPPLVWFAHPFRFFRFTSCRAHPTPPRLVMSKGTSDSSPRGRGELPGQAGADHGQTAERGGHCSAGAGQENHQAASAAATSGKQGDGKTSHGRTLRVALEAAYSSDLGVRFGFKLSDNCLFSFFFLKMNVVWKQLEVQITEILSCSKV